MLSITVYRKTGECTTGIEPGALEQWLSEKDAVIWVDIEAHTDEDIQRLADSFHFHPLALDDVRTSHQRPKIELYDSYAFVVFYAIELDEDQRSVRLEEVELFIGQNFVVTVHDTPIQELKQTHQRWESSTAMMEHSTTTLLYALLDTMLDDYFPVLDRLSDHINEVEQRIFEEFDPELLRETLQLKRDLLALRRIVAPQRDVINVLLRGEGLILPDSAIPYLQDLYDHSLRVVEMVDTYREMVSTVTEGFLSVQSNNINVVMQRLTVINLLLLPLTVLTGFFGMNFESIPFDSPLLLGVALTAMILLPTSLFWWLRRQGWG